MTKYLKQTGKNGRTLYFIDGKISKVTDIPSKVIDDLQDGVEIEYFESFQTPVVSGSDPLPLVNEAPKECLYCQATEGLRPKMVHLRMVWLCGGDYESHTTGQIGAKVREVYA